MPTLSPLVKVDAAQRFRALIRPSLVGYIGQVEPRMSQRMAEAMVVWMQDVIRETVQDSRMKDAKGEVLRQLLSGARVTGRASLITLTGAVWTYPWLRPHEFGATIYPKNAEFLALPIFWALRPDGTPIFRNPTAWKRYGSFVYTQKATGRKFLAYRNKTTGQLRILYILKDKAEIPARLGLTRHLDQHLGDLLRVWGSIYVEEAAAAGIPQTLFG